MRVCFIWLVMMTLSFGLSGIAQGEQAPTQFRWNEFGETSLNGAYRGKFGFGAGDWIDAKTSQPLAQNSAPRDAYWQYYADCDRWEVEFDTQWIETDPEFEPADSAVEAARIKPVEPSLSAAVAITVRNSERLSELANGLWRDSHLRQIILAAEFRRVETPEETVSLLPIKEFRDFWGQMAADISGRFTFTYLMASNLIENHQRQIFKTAQQWFVVAKKLPQQTIPMLAWGKTSKSIVRTFHPAKFQLPARPRSKQNSGRPMLSTVRAEIADRIDWIGFRLIDIADHIRPTAKAPKGDDLGEFERPIVARRGREHCPK